ncbi:uncharacterized protein LOC110996449 isoform X2 [Pieris rapae]|uniref:uncharacterized protein LOC110996449 isoform X2 n=1 Tax=Pieris rapae TaxID=64459 RepID=UPI001E27A9AB|nr:uncharacterized protein LOC110996449 isoform X2 [Pieris rapae]
MPDKNKKRKNNKNKRKNKGQQQPSNNNTRISTVTCDQRPEGIKKSDCSAITRNEITESQEKLVGETGTPAVTTSVDSEISTDLKQLPKKIESSSAIPPSQSTSAAGIITKENTQLFEGYTVESPEKTIKSIPKLRSDVKSKSADNDDRPIIVEIVEGLDKNDISSSLADSSNIIISEFEPEVEWENTCDIKKFSYIEEENVAPGVLSIITLPLNVAECEEIKSMSPEEEKSLRQYLNTLNLSSNTGACKELEIKPEIEQQVNHDIKQRLRKKQQTEEIYSSMTGPARSLHVIDEEASGESSSVSRRHSYLIDKKSEDEELDDDVFYATNETKPEIKFRKGRKSNNLISQECIRVDAQLKNPEITEARGSWTTSTVEKITGAEIVYLTDSSSSTSSLYDNNEIEEKNDDSDVSVRIITPTIEVVDTDKFLKNDYNFNVVKSQVEHKINNNSLEDDNEKANQKFDNYYSENERNDKNISKDNHEILVLSTDNINTNLFVKDVEKPITETLTPSLDTKKVVDNYDLEIKVLKCELNDAINNLINEVVSETDATQEYHNDSLERQDSSSSVGSSQCTAKYNPKCSSLNDISMAEFDENDKSNESLTHSSENKSHVKDVIINVQNINRHNITYNRAIETPSLRDMCLEKICNLPYGEQILEELASVSQRLQTLSDHAAPIGLSRITTFKDINSVKQNGSSVNTIPRDKIVTPPAVQPRKSSLKINQDDALKNNSIKSESKRYNCLSPSQKMLMETTNSLSHLKNTNTSEQKENVINKIELSNPIDVPFKSQTGSRLLALLRNPLVTTNSQKPKSNFDNNSNIDETHTSQGHIMRVGREFPVKPRSEQSIHSPSNNFKPIPPPKPRKYSSSLYESDESSDFLDNSFKSVKNHKKYFHFSTGNLSQEIEDDISSIQNMHRHYNDRFRQARADLHPRRPSLPKDLCDQQMEYIRRKEKEVEAEICRLERERINTPQKRGPRAPMLNEEFESESYKSFNRIRNSQSHGVLPALISPSPGKLSSVFSKSQEELLRNKMYTEYLSQMAEREERKQKKIIKITKTPCSSNNTYSKSSSELTTFDSKVNNRIEKEFIDRAKDRWNKLGFKDPETEDEYDRNAYKEPKVIEHKIKVIDSGEEKDVQKLPNHLQDFVKFRAKDKSVKSESPETVMIAPTFKARSTSPAIWTPGAQPPVGDSGSSAATPPVPPPPPPPPVWTPNSATASPQTPHKTFRPVHFEESPPARRKFENKEPNGCMNGSEGESRLRTSHSAPVTGFNSLGNKLPKAPNPTVTLLQKAREGQLSRASQQAQGDSNSRLPRDRPSPPFGDPIHALRRGYVSEGEGERRERNSATKMAETQKKIEGIGPITNDGMPVTLRSEVKDPSRWYKKMYDTIHKNKYDNEPQRVSSSKSQYAYFDPRSGYLSEPEGGLSRLTSGTWSDAYDSDVTSGPRRRTASVQEDRRNDVTSPYMANNKYSTLASTRASQEVYKSQPGKIENYTPGKSSVVDKEAKQWWDEVMDIFDGWLDDNSPLPPYSTLLARAIQKNQNMSSTTMSTTSLPKEKKDITSAILSKSNMARALKESGYESDSTLVFKRREDTEAPLSPAERRAAYRDLQAGGEPPLRGFRSPAPPRTETDSTPEPPRRMPQSSFSDSESPSRRYVESDVNIHYRCPVRHDPLPLVPERELARQQAEHMKRLYREQKRNKYLQENDYHPIDIEAFDASIKELQDMQSRRHQDNFMPSQKTIVPLNRYDEADRVVARALYTFNGQTARELSFRKGDIINVRRQIDNNWYEGEFHGRIGLFPYNYVELLKGDVTHSPKKPLILEGRARAKFDFTAQTNLELPLKKGELVVLARRIDHNWWEGRVGNKTGIFPDSYVTILQEPSQGKPEPQPILSTDKPVASPAAHGVVNGDKRSLGAHTYTPQHNSAALANAPPATEPLIGYPAKGHSSPADRGLNASVNLNNTEPLYVDTNAEAVPYRAMYKYRPQNPDELELNEGDTVYVLEKCDDGWYVGSSQRTGRFGTFPGNYVERI